MHVTDVDYTSTEEITLVYVEGGLRKIARISP